MRAGAPRAGARPAAPPCLRRSARLPMLPASGSRPRLAAPLATQAWTGGCPRARRFRDGQTDGRPTRRSPGRQGRRRKRWGEGGREGRGRIGSLSSTGTTELSCHGEGGAAGRACSGRRSHMPAGRRQRRANPHLLPAQPPPAQAGPTAAAPWGKEPLCTGGSGRNGLTRLLAPPPPPHPQSCALISGCAAGQTTGTTGAGTRAPPTAWAKPGALVSGEALETSTHLPISKN